LLLSCLLGTSLFSQNIEFIENKGQWDPAVLYAGQVAGGMFYIHRDGYTVVQHKTDDWQRLRELAHHRNFSTAGNFILHSHAYRVSFEGGNTKAWPQPDKPLPAYSNYFLGDDPSKWATDCKTYQAITVRDVYPNIDLRYYADQGTLKYDLIVKPGADPDLISLKYSGASKIQVRNKELQITTTVGNLREKAPYSYQYDEKGKVEVPARFVVKDSTVRFALGTYDSKTTLVIDPTLIFVSLSGSTADNWGFTATYGPDGSMFGGGIVFAPGFPVSPGAFQTSFGGGPAESDCFNRGFDIGIIKLTPDGTNRVYATYIGGSMNEMPQSLIVDGAGNLVVAGRSNSPNYPTTGSVIGSGGGWDITITKLNASGNALIGSRRIGGSGLDGANITACGGGANSLQQNYGDESRSEVNLDGAGNIFLASCTQSTAPGAGQFPVTAGAAQTAPGGQQDGVVLKFNPNLSTLLFSTFLGGGANDAAYVLSISPLTGLVFVAGGSESASLPGSSAGTISASNRGRADGFVAVLTPDGSSFQRSTFLGTAGIDQVYGIQFDKFGFPYVMGQTTGNWPNINAAWTQPNGRQFISKLQPDLSGYVYSMSFGKGAAAPDISPVAFLVDRCENVYVSGWGGSVVNDYPNAGVNGLPVTPDAIKGTPDLGQNGLGQDFYFFVLQKNATGQLYGSFFGKNNATDHVDGGTSRFDQNGVIYQAICAVCDNTTTFPTTPGAWATSKPASALCNLAMVKISFDFAGVGAAVQSSIEGIVSDTAGCVPLRVDFRDTLSLGVTYEWNFGDGSPMVTTNSPNISHTFNSVGNFRVMLVAVDSASCNIRDTSYINIRVGASRAQVGFTQTKLDPCNEFRYRFDNTSVAPAGFPFSGQTFIWDFGDNSPRVTTGLGPVTHRYASPGTYTVKLYLVDTTYCNSPDSAVRQLRVADLVRARFSTPRTGCAPYTAQFQNNSLGGSQFIWDFGDGTGSGDESPSHVYNTPGTYTIQLIAIDDNTCNRVDTTRFTITVAGKPVASFPIPTPQPPAVNTPLTFVNESSADAVRFKWIFGDGDSLLTASRAPVSHEYNTTGTFNACLVAINSAGCPDTLCRSVRTLVEPAVDVPNAFTPLSNDGNSVVFVRGFGIARMKFIVWARWGEKVFESDSKQFGWNGRYKGNLLPMDVYAYTLEVEFTDGTKASKKGDITLIR
jgi:gliding motility-associated-like protein